MKLRNLAITAFAVIFGGFIGYDPFTPSQTVQAGEMVIPRVVDVPNNGKNLALNIDLRTDKVTVGETSADATVTITKDVETRLEYRTKEVEKEVYVENTIKTTKLLNRLMPLPNPQLGLNLSPKRNGDR